jgi:hypothetical protein
LVEAYPTPRTIQQHGFELAFRAYKFEGMGNTLYVYFMVRDNRKGQQLAPALTAPERIKQAFRGERILSRELIQLVVMNSVNESAAWQSARSLIEPHLVVSPGE